MNVVLHISKLVNCPNLSYNDSKGDHSIYVNHAKIDNAVIQAVLEREPHVYIQMRHLFKTGPYFEPL